MRELKEEVLAHLCGFTLKLARYTADLGEDRIMGGRERERERPYSGGEPLD
jgi:hypothetical protein